MPLYFFDTPDGPLEKDLLGTVLAEARCARAFAMRVAATVAMTNPETLANDATLRIVATDEAGTVVARISLRRSSEEMSGVTVD